MFNLTAKKFTFETTQSTPAQLPSSRLSSRFLARALSAACAVWSLSSCTAREESLNGFSIYADIRNKASVSYALSTSENPRVNELLTMTLESWNRALGKRSLLKATTESSSDVIIDYVEVDELRLQPAHVELTGCLQQYQSWSECRIKLFVPRKIESLSDMQKVAHLFRQGPLDAELYERFAYTDVSHYLRDKLISLTLAHEIGHTLGLAHSSDPACLMAASPRGELGFCAEEISTARLLLTNSRH